MSNTNKSEKQIEDVVTTGAQEMVFNFPGAEKPPSKEVIAALVEVQRELKPAVRDATNPHFKSRYADLESVYEACREALTKHGFFWTCQTFVEDETVFVKTSLLHAKTGDGIHTTLPALNTKKDMQGLGSALTYARRYSLMSLVGICPEDDDANLARKAAPPPAPAKASPPPAENRPSTKNRAGDWEKKPGWETELCTDAQRKKLWAMAKEVGFNEATLKELVKTSMGVDSTKQLTKSQIQTLFQELEDMLGS